MGNFGMREELLGTADIWMCMQCKKCSNVCPQQVEPASAILFLRNLAEKEGFVSRAFVELSGEIDNYIQLLRHEVYKSFLSELNKGISPEVNAFINEIIGSFTGENTQSSGEVSKQVVNIGDLGLSPFHNTEYNMCLTCRECSESCVVSRSIKSFDPAKIIRMHHLGMEKTLYTYPEIWECISCETCSEVCKQGVKGHQLVTRLREMAIEKEYVPSSIFEDMEKIEKSVHMLRFKMISLALERKDQADSMMLGDLSKSAIHLSGQ